MRESSKFVMIPSILTAVAVLLIIPGSNGGQLAFAQDAEEKIEIKVADHLKNNPLALKIIEEMERQKLQYKNTNQIGKPRIIVQQDFEMSEKLQDAKERLAQRLAEFQAKYADYTPRAAFTKFVEKKPAETHPVFWGQFEYMQGKVDSARDAMKQVIESGGSLKDARDAYFAHAATKRVELIQVTQELNVKYGLADPDVQRTFDKYGKLPRYDD